MLKNKVPETKIINYIEFLSGLLGGLVSVSICHPLDVARTRINVQNSTISQNKYNGLFDAFKTIKYEEGFKGFYKGYSATVISIPLFNSLFFMIYNQMKPYYSEKFKNVRPMFIHIISSISTGLICDIITNPLWVARTRMQVQFLHNQNVDAYNGVIDTFKKMYHQEGFKSFYKGLGASLLGLTHVAVYFPIYEEIKLQFQQKRQGQLLSKDIFIASIISKLVACFLTYPHVVLRARLMDDRQNNKGNKLKFKLIEIAKQIYKKDGLKGFYSALRIDLFRVLPQNSIIFVVYEYTKKKLKDQVKQVA